MKRFLPEIIFSLLTVLGLTLIVRYEANYMRSLEMQISHLQAEKNAIVKECSEAWLKTPLSDYDRRIVRGE